MVNATPLERKGGTRSIRCFVRAPRLSSVLMRTPMLLLGVLVCLQSVAMPLLLSWLLPGRTEVAPWDSRA